MGDHWPEPETLPAAPPPPPVPPPDDRRIGSGMLLALAVLALVGLGFLITWLLTRSSSSPQASTIVITTTTAPATTTNATPSTSSTTAPTTAPTTTASSPPRRPATATVPDVTQQTEEDGADSLVKAGLLPSIAFVPAKDPLGTIEAQAQPSGSTVAYHSHVQINISSGPGEKPLEAVPNVIGNKLPQAVSALNAAGLRLIYVRYAITDKSKAGTIVQQTPLAGERAPHNSQVLVYMGAVES